MTIISGSELWNIIILVGAVQGFILSVLLFFRKQPGKVSNRLLASLIFLLALACCNLYITESGLYEDYVFVQILQQVFPFIIIMPIGPLIYFYIQSLVNSDFRMNAIRYRHFYPVIIDLVPRLLVWIFLAGLLIGIFQIEEGPEWGDFIDSYNTYSDIPRWLSITLYVLVTKRFLTNLSEEKQNTSDSDSLTQARIRWIHQFLHAFLAFQVIWFIFLVPYIIPSTRGYLLDNMSYYPIYIPLAILIYWLAFKGYLHTQLISSETVTIQFPLSSGPQQIPASTLSFPREEAAAYIGSLKKAMQEDKLYLEPSLNVQAVSNHTHIPPKTISYILNNYEKKSFNEFVNEYRIAEVKRRLVEKANEHLTISGIALDCGFNSQATFQRAFKSAVGVSPKEYLSLQPQKSA
ncbi:AraC family transcriptional regulator [Rhodocytophaga rosea]|uniref:AraC family transcriptional regulator n=1 Tax=Rhodocytophaga rosea TaxID=2704465 RepID=A0A6C0GIP9_9BACT|nr:helix-turn-helix domain-containing protein [Rhodocytophaga rosea]QHT67878.1 AraC family transcriptional regulator [Rhodocytophaga rosea]